MSMLGRGMWDDPRGVWSTIIPFQPNCDLGSQSNPFQNLYLSGSAIIGADLIGVDGSNNTVFNSAAGYVWKLSGITALTLDPGGNLIFGTLGGKLSIAEGSNAASGVSTLSAGATPTISTTALAANSRVMYCRQTAGGTPGNLSIAYGSNSFVISSTSNTDTSTVFWVIIDHH